MDRKYELIRYFINEYISFFESEYNFVPMKFFEWISEAAKLDYYKKEILELKTLIY